MITFVVRIARPICSIGLCLWLPASSVAAQPAERRPAESRSAERQAPEPQLKAAYLYKFAGFIEWPPERFARADSPLWIGVAGNDELAARLEQIVVGRRVNGHALAVRRVHPGETLADLHILYLGPLDRDALATLLAAARGQAVLTVSDSGEAAALGSMVNFVMAQERLRFEVALPQVAPSGLKISARMLSAAQRIVEAS